MGLKNSIKKSLQYLVLAGALFSSACAPLPQLTPLSPDTSWLEQRINQESHSYQDDKPKKVAVVLCSPDHKNDTTILEDLGKTYDFLTENDFLPENIYFLSNTSEEINCDKNNQPYFKNDGKPSKKAFEMLQEHLEEKIKPEDLFAMYIIAHADENGVIYPRPYYLIKNHNEEKLSPKDLTDFLKNVPTDVLVLNACYSGNIKRELLNRLTPDNSPIIVCSSDNGPSFKKAYPSDTPNFFSVFNSAHTEDTSVQQAFERACKKASKGDNPQIYDPRNINNILSLQSNSW